FEDAATRQVVQHMGLPGKVPKLLRDAQRSLPVLLTLGSARPHFNDVKYEVRPALCFQLISRLCFGEAALRPSASIRVATLVDPAERVLDLQLCTNGPCLRTCRAAN